jgi:signal transduction histidine kinase
LKKTRLPDLQAVAPRRDASPDLPLTWRDLAGREVLTAQADIPTLNWNVIVDLPVEEAFAPLYQSLLRSGLLVLGGLVVSIWASLAMARHMVRPINALHVGAAKIGAGELSHRITVRTGDELETLADQFNHMAEQLESSYAGLEQKIRDRTRDLEIANRHKSEFLAHMSHELRTPLNAIIGFADVLRERMFGELNPKQAEYMDDIHASGQHLFSVINDILDLSKIEAGRMGLELSAFDLPRAIGNALTLVSERAARCGIKLEREIDPRLGSFTGDERKFKQILLNLLSNSIKFTPEGGRILVKATATASTVEISVSDSGVGIAPADQEIIFEEFRQVQGSDGRSREGTGLGLTLTRKFVEMHGGRISVRSEPGEGSTFTFTLPEQPCQMPVTTN